jgi:hypothetical protein
LVGYLETTVAEGEVYKPGETFQIGWCTTVIQKGDDELIISEPDRTGKIPPSYVDSLIHTILDHRDQTDTADSVGLFDEMDFPHFEDSCIVCKNIGSIGYWHSMMGRRPTKSGESRMVPGLQRSRSPSQVS